MTKSQLILAISAKLPAVPHRDVEAVVNAVFDCMAEALSRGQRIELRGFGSLGVKTRPARSGRNPKTGEQVHVPPRRSLTFTVGKELRDRLNPAPPELPLLEPARNVPAAPAPASAPAPAPAPAVSAPSRRAPGATGQPLAAAAPRTDGWNLR